MTRRQLGSLGTRIREALLQCSLMSTTFDIEPVITGYLVIGDPTEVRYLAGAGGFSGARFWRIESPSGTFCLRRWPVEYPRMAELEFMHRVLQHAEARGFDLAPVPLENSEKGTCVSRDGYLWELTRWMPGEADTSTPPSETRVVAAMECLAQFHQATGDFVWDGRTPHGEVCPGIGPSPGIRKRIALCDTWLAGRPVQLEEALNHHIGWEPMVPAVEQLLRFLPDTLPTVAKSLTQSAEGPAPLQPCIRDVWPDHILFQDDQVTGLIDFGSMGIDSVSCDVARLLGGMAPVNSDLWNMGLQAYAAIRPMGERELDFVSVFHKSGLLLGTLNWAAWVFLERRTFEEPRAVLERMDALMNRFETDLDFPPSGRGLLL